MERIAAQSLPTSQSMQKIARQKYIPYSSFFTRFTHGFTLIHHESNREIELITKFTMRLSQGHNSPKYPFGHIKPSPNN